MSSLSFNNIYNSLAVKLVENCCELAEWRCISEARNNISFSLITSLSYMCSLEWNDLFIGGGEVMADFSLTSFLVLTSFNGHSSTGVLKRWQENKKNKKKVDEEWNKKRNEKIKEGGKRKCIEIKKSTTTPATIRIEPLLFVCLSIAFCTCHLKSAYVLFWRIFISSFYQSINNSRNQWMLWNL